MSAARLVAFALPRLDFVFAFAAGFFLGEIASGFA